MKNKYLLSTIILILLLLSLSIPPLLARSLGTTVNLKAMIYNTEDSVRGKGVIINYDIEQVATNKLATNFPYSKTRTQAYAVLKKTDDYYIVDKILPKKPKNNIYLKCYLYTDEISSPTIYVQYDLDHYFQSYIQNDNNQPKETVALVKIYGGYGFLQTLLTQNNNK